MAFAFSISPHASGTGQCPVEDTQVDEALTTICVAKWSKWPSWASGSSPIYGGYNPWKSPQPTPAPSQCQVSRAHAVLDPAAKLCIGNVTVLRLVQISAWGSKKSKKSAAFWRGQRVFQTHVGKLYISNLLIWNKDKQGLFWESYTKHPVLRVGYENTVADCRTLEAMNQRLFPDILNIHTQLLDRDGTRNLTKSSVYLRHESLVPYSLYDLQHILLHFPNYWGYNSFSCRCGHVYIFSCPCSMILSKLVQCGKPSFLDVDTIHLF
jgi:hypothetical protein